jgi:hypothetical protein
VPLSALKFEKGEINISRHHLATTTDDRPICVHRVGFERFFELLSIIAAVSALYAPWDYRYRIPAHTHTPLRHFLFFIARRDQLKWDVFFPSPPLYSPPHNYTFREQMAMSDKSRDSLVFCVGASRFFFFFFFFWLSTLVRGYYLVTEITTNEYECAGRSDSRSSSSSSRSRIPLARFTFGCTTSPKVYLCFTVVQFGSSVKSKWLVVVVFPSFLLLGSTLNETHGGRR